MAGPDLGTDMDREDYDSDGDYVFGANIHSEYGEQDDEGDEQDYSYPEEEVDEEDIEIYGVNTPTYDNASDDGGDEAYERSPDSVEVGREDEDEDIGENELLNADSESSHRHSALQELLGTLTQRMESGPHGNSSETSRHVNIADIFPEMFTTLNGSVRTGSRDTSRMAKLLTNVSNAQKDPYMAMESLREISEQLLMLSPLTAERAIPQEELLKGIVSVLADPLLQGELELQLIACRCLYNLFEVNPDMISLAVDQNVICACNDKLMEISYIDLAEQVLETLEIISRLHGREIQQSGSLLACLQYLDFFTIHAQKKAVTIVVNSCTRVQISDFDYIADVMWKLKEVFSNSSDTSIKHNMLNAFYGICSGLGSGEGLLENLFDFELIQSIMQLVIGSDNGLDSRLRAFDILTQVVSKSEGLAPRIIGSKNIMSMLISSFDEFRRNSTSPLHEKVMFAPKALLISISRFLVVLFPVEECQVLSADKHKSVDFSDVEKQLKQLVKDVVPLLVEIYINAVDFDIRRLVLIVFSRIAPHMPEEGAICKKVVPMIASSLARNKSLFEESKFEDLVSGGLLLGNVQMVLSLVGKHNVVYLPAFKREGVIDLLKDLSLSLSASTSDKSSAGGSCQYASTEEEYGESSDGENDRESNSGDDYNMEFGESEVSGFVRPSKISFGILKHLRIENVRSDLATALKTIDNLSKSEDTNVGELGDIDSLVERLRVLKVQSDTYDIWFSLWTEVKSKLFRPNFVISSFEFISSGLAEELSKIVLNNSSKTSICQRALVDAFGTELEAFVEILQTALTRLESFELVDCGLHGNEGRAASLGRQMKLKLEYEGNAAETGIPVNLQTIVVSIHCIASFKSLNDFLKHRVVQSRLLTSLVSVLAVQGGKQSDLEEWDFEFSLVGADCSHHNTIFGAIFNACKYAQKDKKSIWTNTHSIKYKKTKKKETKLKIEVLYSGEVKAGTALNRVDALLVLLKALLRGSSRPDCFVNSKLSAKLACQLEEPLVVAGGILPSWTLHLTQNYPFLFPFETRMFFLQSTSFGHGRLIQLWKNRTHTNKVNGADTLHQLGRPTRHKLRVSRDDLLLSAIKILTKYGSSPNILEIEYQNEVGTGLGPTLEFYAIVSKEFARKSLGLWRCDNYAFHDKTGFVEGLLYPAPLRAANDEKRILELFSQLGAFVSRSMLDDRLLDFRFNRAFFELSHMRCRGETLSFADLEFALQYLDMVDPQLTKSLRYVLDLKNDQDIESLALTFYLPGYDVELVENGKNTPVTASNLREYLEKVLDQVLGTGVEKQISSFIQGFSQAFPYSSLLILTPDELTKLFGRIEEDWTTGTLLSYIDADHGYNQDSEIIHNLVTVMSSFTDSERRLFLQFLTGSPKLPIGGFKSLSPKLTVVRKHTEDNLEPDQYLPSVMTCANYLKLPKYSSLEVLRSRLIQAMTEGGGAFLLS